MIRFQDKLINILRDRGETYDDLRRGCGVNRVTIYRGGNKKRTTIAAICYHLKMDAMDLVKDTELEDIWHEY